MIREHYDPASACAASGASADQLRQLEELGLLVPTRHGPPWRRQTGYTRDQVAVLRWFAETGRRSRAQMAAR